jgi:hypothetical protein
MVKAVIVSDAHFRLIAYQPVFGFLQPFAPSVTCRIISSNP